MCRCRRVQGFLHCRRITTRHEHRHARVGCKRIEERTQNGQIDGRACLDEDAARVAEAAHSMVRLAQELLYGRAHAHGLPWCKARARQYLVTVTLLKVAVAAVLLT